MPEYRLVVRREIPCAPWYADVTPAEVSYLGLYGVAGHSAGSAPAFPADNDADAEMNAADTAEAVDRCLDRTSLVCLNEAGEIVGGTSYDLSE